MGALLENQLYLNPDQSGEDAVRGKRCEAKFTDRMSRDFYGGAGDRDRSKCGESRGVRRARTLPTLTSVKALGCSRLQLADLEPGTSEGATTFAAKVIDPYPGSAPTCHCIALSVFGRWRRNLRVALRDRARLDAFAL